MATGTDEAWWSQDGERGPAEKYRSHEVRSRYVELADGTRVAVDVYLPSGLPAAEQLTTFFCSTPYFRRFEFRSRLAEKLMARAFTGGGANWWPALARYGHAVVVVEQRGSGASFGQRSLDIASEVKDMADVVDWVVDQPWSDGRVVPIGVSAMGLNSLYLLTSRHPAVAASMPMFAAFDLYTATHPGGLMFDRSLENIGNAMRAMDSNRMTEMAPNRVLGLAMRLLVRGLHPVDDDDDRSQLAEAVRDHAGNAYIDVALLSVEQRDDPMEATAAGITIDARSPATYADDMRAADVPLNGYIGWWDSGSTREMLNLFAAVPTGGSRLVIGPWGHAGTKQIGPGHGKGAPSRFDFAADIARFLQQPAGDTRTIHYFTLREDRWKTTTSWPPAALAVGYHLGDGGRLAPTPTQLDGSDRLAVDATVGTGPLSRWALEKHPANGVEYADRTAVDAKLLTYTTAPLPQHTEVTGHPRVRLFASSSDPDAVFIVYLEEVTADGSVFYVTEGELRAVHRMGASFTRADMRPVTPGEVMDLAFDMQPISYRFPAGSALRVTIAGGDADNFRPSTAKAPTIEVYWGPDHPSAVALPVVVSGT